MNPVCAGAVFASVLLCAHVVVADTITLNDHSHVIGLTVRLSDIADLTGAEAERLARVQIVSLSPQQTRATIAAATVRRALDGESPRWGRLTLRGATTVVVERGRRLASADAAPLVRVGAVRSNAVPRVALTGPPESLREHLLQYVYDTVGAAVADIDVTFTDRDAALLSRQTSGERYEFEPMGSDMVGRVPVNVRCYRGDELIETVRVRLHVRVRRDAVLARRELRRGEVIAAEDLKTDRIWLDSDVKRPLRNAGPVVGQTVVRTVTAGRPMSHDDIRPALMVKRGETIFVRCVSGNLVMSVTARALSDGALNEVITVEPIKTRERYMVRVTGPQQAVKTIEAVNPGAVTAMAHRAGVSP